MGSSVYEAAINYEQVLVYDSLLFAAQRSTSGTSTDLGHKNARPRGGEAMGSSVYKAAINYEQILAYDSCCSLRREAHPEARPIWGRRTQDLAVANRSADPGLIARDCSHSALVAQRGEAMGTELPHRLPVQSVWCR